MRTFLRLALSVAVAGALVAVTALSALADSIGPGVTH
jgi:hypothetical protein